jgi:sugar O-acyltransferase (sialic acid O-acetyltransferase NeuD family)
MKEIVIFGNSQFAEMLHYYLSTDSGYRVRGFTVDAEFLTEDTFCGQPVVPFEEVASRYPPGRYEMFLGIGYSGLNSLRARKFDAARALGYSLPSYIHPSSHVAETVEHGEHCLILEKNVVLPFARIGDNVVIWASNAIGHHASIGDHAWITMNATISGESSIGPRCFVGAGAVVGPRARIGSRCILGAKSLVLKDAADDGVYASTETPRSAVPSRRMPGF